MPKQRKEGNRKTTISVRWSDKEEFRRFAKLVKKTKTGENYEPDYVLFYRMMKYFGQYERKNEVSTTTYPHKVKKSVPLENSSEIQDKSQPSSSL